MPITVISDTEAEIAIPDYFAVSSDDYLSALGDPRSSIEIGFEGQFSE